MGIVMSRDNVSAIVTAVAVISLITGFGIYFNYYGGTSHSYLQQKQLEQSVVHSSMENGNMLTIKLNKTTFLNINKNDFVKAPELAGIKKYINTVNDQPIKLAAMKGKVVLVDFWTYTCINCIRTIPHLNDWYDRYASDGFIIIGVHSPEFEFEKNPSNVQDAVNKFGIKYPVVLDNDHKTWNVYQNNYWPRDYLIDSQGYIREDHIGEGGYNETEKAIQILLAEKAALDNKKEISFNLGKGNLSSTNPRSLYYVNTSKNLTPEIYLGYSLARAPLGNIEGFQPDKEINYKLNPNTTSFEPNLVYLEGKWKNNNDNLELVGDTGKIILTYYAKAINMVASGNGQKVTIVDTTNSKTNSKNLAVDIDKNNKNKNNTITVNKQRLYNVGLYNDYDVRSIVINIEGKGFQIYTFTFG